MNKLNVTRQRGRPVGQSDDLTEEELQLIVSLPDRRTKDGLRDYAVLLVFANTPMRKGELVRLRLGNLVDEGAKKFITYQGLKKRKRKDGQKSKPYWLKIPITPKVFDGLKRYVESEYKTGKLDHTAPLFLTLGKHGAHRKAPLTPWAVDGIVAKYVKRAGIKKRITPHSFRASYITQRSDGGHNPETIRGLSGHADIRGIMPYIRSSEKKRSEAALSHSVS